MRSYHGWLNALGNTLEVVLGRVIPLVVGISAGVASLLIANNLELYKIHRLIGVAAHGDHLSEILFLFIPLITLAIMNLAGHLMNYSHQMVKFSNWLLLLWIGVFVIQIYTVSVLWVESHNDSKIDLERLKYVEGVVYMNVILLIFSEIAISTSQVWAKRK